MPAWLIIGGGIHGTYLSNLLTGEAGVSPDDIRVLDPHGTPLAVWNRHTGNCGMTWLRSPGTHNIDLHILSVRRFAASDAGSPFAEFIPPYFRPSLKLFRKHCEHVIRKRGLAPLRIQGRALAVRRSGSALSVETETGTLKARRVILCPGMGDRLCYPAWAAKLRAAGRPVRHVFEPAFRRDALPEGTDTVVVGGGITAVQLALALCREQKGRTSLLSRHPLRENNLDFDPCWIGPKCLTGFHRTAYPARRKIVDAARNRGTVTQETMSAFRQVLRGGQVGFEQTAVRDANGAGERIRLRTDAGDRYADRVILATGFDRCRPGGPLTDQMIREFGLRTATCGFPVTDPFFRWHENIFVTGALAELQGGPCSRNIVGVRNIGRQLLKYIREFG
ncbi:hypothetical protein DENIS_4665 [Desulfonema ishimotonii]|uniref:FAD/NAD(P)-binding domain-containing protein n=1 Tax=Desulfonema ishimotonii TaxID=45657 RepID=A0A401G356_9BACT|nr:FAD/NAD(P)-binding protein [Desulfonema ishimotonii]GBC63667.1 hypothetical protein DENIS_4665 [Desulfonema ishimotonii]